MTRSRDRGPRQRANSAPRTVDGHAAADAPTHRNRSGKMRHRAAGPAGDHAIAHNNVLACQGRRRYRRSRLSLRILSAQSVSLSSFTAPFLSPSLFLWVVWRERRGSVARMPQSGAPPAKQRSIGQLPCPFGSQIGRGPQRPKPRASSRGECDACKICKNGTFYQRTDGGLGRETDRRGRV